MTETLPIEVELLQKELPQAIKSFKLEKGDLMICLNKSHLIEAITLLKESPTIQYDFFSECLGVDYSKWDHPRDFEERFEVVYNLMSLDPPKRLFLKVGVNDNESVPSLITIFPGAEYPEREIWDLFGITFKGNEQKQRFLLPDDWVGHPLRKEYPLGGEEVLFDQGDRGPSVGDIPKPRAGESFDGKTGTKEISPEQ